MQEIEVDLPEEIVGFSPSESAFVVDNFLCACCWGPLMALHVRGDYLYIVVCPEHGNVETCGRVTKSTVSINMEKGYKLYQEVIRNLPDLWGHLAQKGFDWVRSKMIRKDYVCAECGRPIYQEMIEGDRERVNLVCSTHGNINKCGYIKKESYANRRSH